MRLRGVRRSRNVDDRRGRAAPVAAGVGGLGIIGVLLALLLGGGDGGFSDIADQLQGLGGPPPTQAAQELSAEDRAAGDFIAAVLGTTEEFWGDVFASAGQDYPEPILVLFTRATQSACGGARAEVGPHYCPLDRTIYMDRAFFDELQRRFGASSGDFAEAYVVAHEVGHHVQNVLDIMGEVRGLQQQNPGDANELSVRLELQADCFAGAWAAAVFERGLLERGDIEEALSAASAVGDDRIQEAIQGRVNPESFTHGTSEQRVNWFSQGYDTGDPNTCDTFSGGI
ncbi:MAG: neutral zinc metallopeptidase [Acidimicrobiia bacterium]|nr:neutral zinc metallopeptidase [Acidimicrobiia bacterium]